MQSLLNVVNALSSFQTGLVLLAGYQNGHLACKRTCTIYPKNVVFQNNWQRSSRGQVTNQGLSENYY